MTAGSNHAPPGDIRTRPAEKTSDCPGRTRESGFGGHLAIGDDLAGLESCDHSEGSIFELGQSVPKRRSPMSPSPGAM